MKNRLLPIALAALAALVALTGLAVAGRPGTPDARSSGRTPSVQTGAASALTSQSATLNGTVKPRRSATTAYFEWGKTARYGSSTPAPKCRLGPLDRGCRSDHGGAHGRHDIPLSARRQEREGDVVRR